MKSSAVFAVFVFLFCLNGVKNENVKKGDLGKQWRVKVSQIRHPGHRWKASSGASKPGQSGGVKKDTGIPPIPPRKTGGVKKDTGIPPIPPRKTGSDVIISGKIIFPNIPGNLSFPSCLLVSLEDTSRMDAPSIILSEKTIDLSDQYVGKTIKYKLKARRPRFNWLTTTLHVVLNNGWCAEKQGTEWLRNGDYLNDVQHSIGFLDGKNEYTKDINVIQYGKVDDVKDVTGDDVAPPRPDVKDVTGDDAAPPPGIPGGAKDATFIQASPIQSGSPGNVRKKSGNVLPLIPPRRTGGRSNLREKTVGTPSPIGRSLKQVFIKGNINFPKAPGMLRSSSCLRLTLKDTSKVDAPSIIISRKYIDLSNQYVGKTYQYKLRADKPDDLLLTTTVQAVLNIGWCGKDKEPNWIHTGDYLNDVSHRIKFVNGKDEYTKHIKVVQYV